MNIKIVYHPSGDWEGLYINNILKQEGHSIDVVEVIEALQNYLLSNVVKTLDYESFRWDAPKESFTDEDGTYEGYPDRMPINLPTRL